MGLNSLAKELEGRIKTNFEKAKKKIDEGMKEAGLAEPEVTAQTAKQLLEELMSDIEDFLGKAESGIKGKTGSPAVKQFIKEVKGKLKTMMSGIKETDLRERAEDILEKIGALEEGAMKGSFEALREKLSTALEATNLFPILNGPGSYASPWIRYTFPDRILVSYKDKNYEVPFTVDNNTISFEKPVEVEETYVVKESAGSRETLAGVVIEKPIRERKEYTPNMDFDGHVSLREAKMDQKTHMLRAVLIEAGTNEGKRRHYPKMTIEEAAPIFKGLKNYIDHPTKAEESSKPERSIREWVSTITETEAVDGKIMADIAVHDKWMWDLLQDPVARESIGLSINAKGKSYIGKINGKDMQIVEKICDPKSVDWVTEAGARGRVVELFESRRRGEEEMDLKSITLKELNEANPTLVKEIQDGVKKETDPATLKEAVAAATKPLSDQIRIRDQRDIVRGWLLENKTLHEEGKKRCLVVAETLFENDVKLKEAFDAKVVDETAYAKSLAGAHRIKGMGGDGAGEEGSVLTEAQTALDNRAGFKEEKKEEGK